MSDLSKSSYSQIGVSFFKIPLRSQIKKSQESYYDPKIIFPRNKITKGIKKSWNFIWYLYYRYYDPPLRSPQKIGRDLEMPWQIIVLRTPNIFSWKVIQIEIFLKQIRTNWIFYLTNLDIFGRDIWGYFGYLDLTIWVFCARKTLRSPRPDVLFSIILHFTPFQSISKK